MLSRVAACFTVILLVANQAYGQFQITGEIAKKVGNGLGKMTEDEANKLLPWPATVSFSDTPDADYFLKWEEVRRIRVEFVENFVVTASGTFSDAVDSKTITLRNFKLITKGKRSEEVRKLMTDGFRMDQSKDSKGRDVQTLTWEKGRSLRVYIKDGKVVQGAYTD